MRISIGNTDKNLQKQAEMKKKQKQRIDAGIYWNKKKKRQPRKKNTPWGNKPESTGERKKIKKVSAESKTIQA